MSQSSRLAFMIGGTVLAALLGGYRLMAVEASPVQTASAANRTLLLIGEDTASPYAKQSISALRASLPNPTVIVLERQEHNAMEAGREVLANAIIKFAAIPE